MAHPNFRAAYDFFCIQSMVGLTPHKLCEWWTLFQEDNPQIAAARKPASQKPRRRRRRKPPSREGRDRREAENG